MGFKYLRAVKPDTLRINLIFRMLAPMAMTSDGTSVIIIIIALIVSTHSMG